MILQIIYRISKKLYIFKLLTSLGCSTKASILNFKKKSVECESNSHAEGSVLSKKLKYQIRSYMSKTERELGNL